MLDSIALSKEFGISPSIPFVAYQSENSIVNRGKADWKKETGLLSIWVLGMFNPSDNTSIILPHEMVTKDSKVTTDYFGTIPPDRLREKPQMLTMKADGKYRGKVGVAPGIAKNVAGSYDADRHVLTIIKFDLDKKGDYVNSKWEKQQYPYKGDAVNAYNDGPLKDGSQLGPFYELESSSSARELKIGEVIQHKCITVHFEGEESKLDEIALVILGMSILELKKD